VFCFRIERETKGAASSLVREIQRLPAAKDRLFNGVAGDRARQYRANPSNDEVDDSRTLEAAVIVAHLILS
jgi:hypothetical protein